jgi:ADP-heptose:LPS heptosyltransferase
MSLKKTLAGLFFSAVVGAERLLHGHRLAPVPERVSSVLLLEYLMPLGCCVHRTVLYEAIKRSRPEITITVATPGFGYRALRHNPLIDHLIETPDPITDLCAAVRVLSHELARRDLHPTCTLTGVDSQRTRIALLSLLAGRGWRGGFTQAPELYQRLLMKDRSISHIANDLRLADMLGCNSVHLEPRVFFSPKDISTAEALIAETDQEASGRPLAIFVTQTSGRQSTNWHSDRFAQVIRHAHEQLGCNVAYVGTQTDAAAIESLRAVAGGVGTSFAGRTTVTQLAALLALSDYVVSLDTGTMHVGRASGVPMLIIGPSWQKPVEWMPLGIPNIRILRGLDTPSTSPEYRLDEIEAEQVIAALSNLVADYPASDEQRNARVRRNKSSTDHMQ